MPAVRCWILTATAAATIYSGHGAPAVWQEAMREERIENAIAYYRMSEFFMYDGDPDKKAYYEKNPDKKYR